jgi:hypothetical protein
MFRALLVALLAAACSPSSPTENAAGPAAAEPPQLPEAAPAPPILPADATAVIDAGSIEGEWRVAGVAGQPLSQPFGISATIREGSIRFVSPCITRRYGLEISGGLATARLMTNETPDCVRALTIDERGLERAMGQVKTAYRLPSKALVLDGPAGAVTLFTQ